MVSILDHILDTNAAITEERQRQAELLRREPSIPKAPRRKGNDTSTVAHIAVPPTPVKKPRPSTYTPRSTWAECANGHPRSEYTGTRSDGRIYCRACMSQNGKTKGLKARCRKGHSLSDPDNVMVDGQGHRRCRICRLASREAMRRRRLRP